MKERKTAIDQEAFSYEEKKDGKVFIYWFEKRIEILSAEKAASFLRKIKDASPEDAQILMAKATSHIKRANMGDEIKIVVRGTHYKKSI